MDADTQERDYWAWASRQADRERRILRQRSIAALIRAGRSRKRRRETR